jgi:hypothetical protein
MVTTPLPMTPPYNLHLGKWIDSGELQTLEREYATFHLLSKGTNDAEKGYYFDITPMASTAPEADHHRIHLQLAAQRIAASDSLSSRRGMSYELRNLAIYLRRRLPGEMLTPVGMEACLYKCGRVTKS